MAQTITRYAIVDDKFIKDEGCRKAVEEWLKSKIQADLYKLGGELIRWHPLIEDKFDFYEGQTKVTQRASFNYKGEQ